MIELRNISKRYGDQQVLDNISFTINKGEFVSIVGRSGSGKSTLLNIIGGLECPDTGSVLYQGNDISKFTASETAKYHNTSVGFVFQSFHLEPEYTVYQNVEIPLLIAGRKDRKKAVEDVLKAVGLEIPPKKVKFLSGGECQRACIARAVIMNPDLILADEPCGNLDSHSSAIIMELLRDIVSHGRTVLLVTHNVDDAHKTDRIITISDGKIISDKRISQ